MTLHEGSTQTALIHQSNEEQTTKTGAITADPPQQKKSGTKNSNFLGLLDLGPKGQHNVFAFCVLVWFRLLLLTISVRTVDRAWTSTPVREL